MKFKIGDKVKVYGYRLEEVANTNKPLYSRNAKGTVSDVIADTEIIVDFDDGTASEVHPKQCRRLVKNCKSRSVYVNPAMLEKCAEIDEMVIASTVPQSSDVGTWLEFKEVKRG